MRGYINSEGKFMQVLHGNKAFELKDGQHIEYEVKDMQDTQIEELPTISEVIKLTRSLEKDHAADGWPAVRMREMSALANEVEQLKKENEGLRENWATLYGWMRGQKINFTGDDRFWMGYDDYHFNLKAKMEEIEKGGDVEYIDIKEYETLQAEVEEVERELAALKKLEQDRWSSATKAFGIVRGEVEK